MAAKRKQSGANIKKSTPDRSQKVKPDKANPKRVSSKDVDARKSERRRGKKEKKVDRSFQAYPQLLEIKPNEKYIFHSDYYQIDNKYCACILSFFHTEGAVDNFGAFWGISKIPSGMSDDITILVLEQVRRMSEGWISERQTKAEGIAQMNAKEQDTGGTNTTKGKASRRKRDLEVIAQEIQDGASYLHVHSRLLVKASSLEALDHAISAIDRLYIDRFGTLSAAPYAGEQRRELSRLFRKNASKEGKGFYFTSTEYAGAYSLVTHGLEDPDGEYLGYMIGDVNNSAILFNVNGYKHHVVVANENYNAVFDRAHVSDVWGSKISQSCMLNNGRVVHLVLDGANLDQLGPDFKKLTHKVDMNSGDVNMFEMFGEEDDELGIFSAQMQKLILMAEQAFETTDNDRSMIRGSLEEIATKFYVDQNMWYHNAVVNRHKLRVVNIPHESVPKLEMFTAYLDSARQSLLNSPARDEELIHAVGVLRTTFNNMLSSNGDLFNTITKSNIDGVKGGKRVLYDFSRLLMRGTGVVMAQFVNIIGFAIGNLGLGDTVIIHGAELIDAGIKPYVTAQFDRLYGKGGRVVFLYNNMDKMLADKDFCRFDRADYTVFGDMSDTVIAEYQKLIGQEIPADLSRLITNKSESVCYIRRGFDNVVFKPDLLLGVKGRYTDDRKT